MVSAAELIATLRGNGLTVPEIARAVDRDPSLIRQIARGAKPGTTLAGPLAQLAEVGRVTEPPARRTTRAGDVAKVRGREGAVVPAPSRDVVERTHYRGGRESVVNVGHGRAAREAAEFDAMKELRDAARAGRRVTITMRTHDGKVRTLGGKGGYAAGRQRRRDGRSYPGVLQRVQAEGGDVFGWAVDQANGETSDGSEFDVADVASLEITAYDA